MKRKKVLLICGGGGPEHDISLESAKSIKNALNTSDEFEVHFMEISNHFKEHDLHKFDVAIPCFHGFPGETGDIQSYFELINLPYIGPNSEASKICFNKITTKLWLERLNLPVVPYKLLTTPKITNEVETFFKENQEVFVKASNMGSSIGCYLVRSIGELTTAVKEAFSYSPFVLVEKSCGNSRELEIAVYQYNNQTIATPPGEIITESWYNYKEKYAESSTTKIDIRADLDLQIQEKMQEMSVAAFTQLKLRHLSRIDFFYSETREIFINEINSFPGMTPISLFPKMMEANNLNFKDFWHYILNQK